MNKELRIKNNKGRKTISHELKANSGFTLIEMMVASALFIIVMVIAIGAVLSIVDANRKAQSLQSVMTNLNFAVESMVRDLREGSEYCGVGTSGCPTLTNTTSIGFFNSFGQPTTYTFDPSIGSISKTITINGVPSTSVITAPEVHILNMFFSVKGNGPGDGFQPVIILLIKGQVGLSAKTQSNFQLQTLITQRLLDS